MRGPRIVVLAVTALTASAVLTAPPAWAADEVVCTGQHSVQFDRGISAAGGRTGFSTTGGDHTCTGEVNGRKITGPGTFAQRGTAAGDCMGGSAKGTAHFVLPTADGPVELSAPYELTYGPGFGNKAGEKITATFQFMPVKGNCLLDPVLEILVFQQTTLRP